MVKFLENPKSPQGTASESFQEIGQGINELIGNYRKAKSFEKIGSQLPENQKAIWDSLDLSMKEKLAPSIFTNIQKRAEAQAKTKEKLLSGSKKYIKGEIPDDMRLAVDSVAERYSELINEGMPQHEARDQAVSEVRDFLHKKTAAEKKSFQDKIDKIIGGFKAKEPEYDKEEKAKETGSSPFGGILGGSLMEGLLTPKEDPLAKQMRPKGSEYQYGIASTGAKHPLQMVAGVPIRAAQGIESLMDILSLGQGKALAQMLTGKDSFSESLRDVTGISQLPPEAQEDIDVFGDVANLFIPWGKLGGKGLAAAQEEQVAQATGRPRPPVQEKQVTGASPKQLAMREALPPAASKAPIPKGVPPAQANLQGRVAKAPETATEMRVSRTEPEKRIYPRLQNVQVREQQLKAHPKYVEEIEADAAKRAEQAAARVPKTVKGKDSQKLRIHAAEKELPEVRDSYFKAAARVRALEDEVARLSGAQKESAETLLELAKKDLDDAQFHYQSAFKNLKGGSRRAGPDEMRNAARKKLLDIENAVAEGEEYKLAKMDYSPDLIKEANRISKRKKLPHMKGDDFYNNVHETYMKEYKGRLGKINDEIGKLAKDPSMSSLSRRHQLGKEKDIINKMIESAEAEKKIHYHKFGLREMAERHKATERFKQLQKAEGKPAVKEVAQQKMWKTRIQEAKTPEARAQVIDEGVEKIAAKDPKNAEKVKAEGETLKESVDEMFGRKEPKSPPPPPKKPPEPPLPKGEELFKGKSADEVAKKAKNILRDFQNFMDNLLKKVPIIGKSQIGRDLMTGAFTALWDEFRKEYDVRMSGSVVVAATLGRAKGSGTRVLGNQLAKWAIKEYKIYRAESLYRNLKSKEFYEYPPSIRKEAEKRALGS